MIGRLFGRHRRESEHLAVRGVNFTQREIGSFAPTCALDPRLHDDTACPDATRIHRAAAVLEDVERRDDQSADPHRLAERDRCLRGPGASGRAVRHRDASPEARGGNGNSGSENRRSFHWTGTALSLMHRP